MDALIRFGGEDKSTLIVISSGSSRGNGGGTVEVEAIWWWHAVLEIKYLCRFHKLGTGDTHRLTLCSLKHRCREQRTNLKKWGTYVVKLFVRK